MINPMKDDFSSERYFTIIPTFGIEAPFNFKLYKHIFCLYFQVFRWKIYLVSVSKK